MIRKIVTAEDPVLRKKSKPVKKVDKKVKDLIKDLKDTLVIQKDPEGVGLAAPQIGKLQRVFVILNKEEMRAYVNPEILSIDKSKPKKKKGSDENKVLEGCLSIPHYYGPLERSKKLTLKYLNEKGKSIEEEFTGFDAQIIQHEVDHLDGILYVDHLLQQNIPLYTQNDAGEWEEVEL